MYWPVNGPVWTWFNRTSSAPFLIQIAFAFFANSVDFWASGELQRVTMLTVILSSPFQGCVAVASSYYDPTRGALGMRAWRRVAITVGGQPCTSPGLPRRAKGGPAAAAAGGTNS